MSERGSILAGSPIENFTRGEFLQSFWTLVRLRYRLIWAQARTGSGRIAILLVLYMLGGLIALLFSFSGFTSAIAAIELGRGESIARWTLASLFANGTGLSLLFGLWPREAFSESSMRRYPLNSNERFAVRHAISLLDPTWLIMVAGAFGLAIGYSWLRAGSLVTGIPAVFLFILSNYLATAILLSILGKLMHTRLGSTVIGTVVILAVSFGPLVIASLIAARREDIWRALDQVLRLTPPGAAASMMAGDDPGIILVGAGLLILWCVGLIFALIKLEKMPEVTRGTTQGNISWNDFYDQLGDVLGNRFGPLVSKSLRYHLRSNLIRFSLITSPVIVLMGKFLLPQNKSNKFFLVSLGIFFVMSSATGAALMLNLFGYDAAGIRRYAVLPVSFADAIRASSFASLLLRAVAVFVAFSLWLIFYAEASVTWKMVVMMLSIALASLFLFNALGLWTSVFSPKRANFDAMWNNRLSFGANMVIVGGILVPFWGTMIIAERTSQEVFLDFWWIPMLLLILCIGLYALSLKLIEIPLNSRRERLINLIAGATDN